MKVGVRKKKGLKKLYALNEVFLLLKNGLQIPNLLQTLRLN